MKEILIIAPYYRFHDEGGNGRFRYLCERLSTEGVSVRLVVSSFLHLKKTQRNPGNLQIENLPYKVKLIAEPGYKKNIDFRRIYSQFIFARNLKKYLNQLDNNIGAVYCSIPIPEAAIVAGKFAKRRSIPCIIDVQDLWPESMRMLVDIPILSKALFTPFKYMVDKAYAMADYVIAVSTTYIKRVQEVNRRAEVFMPVFLGTDINRFDNDVEANLEKVQKPPEEFWVTYIGMLGHSYDLKTVILALKQLKNSGYENIRLMVIGDGPLRKSFEEFAIDSGICVTFTGYLDYGLMAAYLKKSDVAVNPLDSKSASSIINKIGDYLTAGLPIINGSTSKELNELIEDWNAGINYPTEDYLSLAIAIELLYTNQEQRIEKGNNSRRLAEEKFNRANTYTEIVDLIKKLLM